MSADPIYNSITVYGTYMNPTSGILQTRIPIPNHGFEPVDPSSLRKSQVLIYVIHVNEDLTDHLTVTNRVIFLQFREILTLVPRALFRNFI
jgi:hypothetical protein